MRSQRRARERQEKRQNRRLILSKLRAALRSFRGQHSQKNKGECRGNWDPKEVQQPIRPNPNRVGDRASTLRRLLIGADVLSRFTEFRGKILRRLPLCCF